VNVLVAADFEHEVRIAGIPIAVPVPSIAAPVKNSLLFIILNMFG
jgi:hypothetical protein